MHQDGAAFVAAETLAWQPYLALAELSDDELVRPVPEAHGWSARDLVGHLTVWQDKQLGYAVELLTRGTTTARDSDDAEYERRGDEWNDELVEQFAQLPAADVRQRLLGANQELRRVLANVPAERWHAHSHFTDYLPSMLDHYAEHAPDAKAILSAFGR